MMDLLRQSIFTAGLLLTLLVGVSSQAAIIDRGFGMPDAAPETAADRAYLQGREFFAKGQLDRAAKAFETALAQTPAHVYARLGMAEVAIQRNDHKTASALLTEAVELAPDDTYVQTVLGRHRFVRADMANAERAFQRALQLDAANLMARINLADLYLSGMKRPDAAARTYRETIERVPDHAGAHFGLGRSLIQLAQFDDAALAFAKAAELAPTNPMPVQALAGLAHRQGDLKGALAHTEQALQRDQTFVPGYLAKGDILLAQGDLESAKKAYLAAVLYAPQNSAAHLRLANYYERSGDANGAIRHYQRVVELDSNNALAQNNLAWLLVRQAGDLDVALGAAKQAVKLAPQAPAFRHTLAWVHRARGELDAASALLAKVVEDNPQAATYLYHLGVIRQEKGEKAYAREAFRRALAIGNDFPGAADAQQRLTQLQ